MGGGAEGGDHAGGSTRLRVEFLLWLRSCCLFSPSHPLPWRAPAARRFWSIATSGWGGAPTVRRCPVALLGAVARPTAWWGGSPLSLFFGRYVAHVDECLPPAWSPFCSPRAVSLAALRWSPLPVLTLSLWVAVGLLCRLVGLPSSAHGAGLGRGRAACPCCCACDFLAHPPPCSLLSARVAARVLPCRSAARIAAGALLLGLLSQVMFVCLVRWSSRACASVFFPLCLQECVYSCFVSHPRWFPTNDNTQVTLLLVVQRP